ncbi:cytochrome P450 [Novosphingobium album (ex Liu et al. 2023)]|uniref:Cytochrome P450 n=1 Tax=Novosphingobium album (ex Liu et al. 2023) TaxID=3031130 RepID=A0ABT5WQS9_9SPHN|nr:cytochrome P450 [Novosphingobium album (ex Liu et al. 2023)]MDE8652401.1 cytochrome P450 [Novosphingobium album (ex Liu et al. 2023)]
MTEITSRPAVSDRDDRKSAAIAARNVRPNPGAKVIGSFDFAREVLRSPDFRQAGAGAEHIKLDNPEHVSVFFLDGELHRKRRSQLARYFTPKAIKTRHQAVMRRATDELIAELRRDGQAQLDIMSMRLACDVAAEIVGLTQSDPAALSERIRKTFLTIGTSHDGPAGWLDKARGLWRTMQFFWRDVLPAIRARRVAPKDDVISYCVQEGFSNKAVLIECMTYATAGMLTTREFIVMVAWHLFEQDALRQRFLAGGEEEQLAILEEILRLEPVAAMVHRRAVADFTGPGGETVKAGEVYAIDMRAVNADPAATGACPFAIDPERARRQKIAGSWMSFADGPHRCPGAQVALHETRVFLDALLRVPGIRLATEPQIGWCAPIMGYEVHGAIVTCDKA